MYRTKEISKIVLIFFFALISYSFAEEIKIPKQNWTFKGITGKFDRASLQRVHYTQSPFIPPTNFGYEIGRIWRPTLELLKAANFGYRWPNDDGDIQDGRPSDKLFTLSEC